VERPRRDSFTFGEKALFLARDYGAAILVAAVLCVLVAAISFLLVRATSGPEASEEARVLGFAFHASRFSQLPIVRVRTADGVVRELTASRQKLRQCRTGDTIRLLRRGTALLVHREGCAGTGRNRDQRPR
jgi:hypothetical protein